MINVLENQWLSVTLIIPVLYISISGNQASSFDRQMAVALMDWAPSSLCQCAFRMCFNNT